ncbi:MAG: hypothetical protein RL318_2169 [Fibrobacterota bacterium]|jgi:hypothetical protein
MPEIVFLQATIKAIFVLLLVLAWASRRRTLAWMLLGFSSLPALAMVFAPNVHGGSFLGGAMLWMGEFPLFGLALCLALPLGFSASLWALLPGVLAAAGINLLPGLGSQLVNIQLQFLQQMATQNQSLVELPTRAQLWESIGLQPGLSAASGFLAATFALLWLGRKDGTGAIALPRPIPPMARLEFPEWPVWGVAVSLALLLIHQSATQIASMSIAFFCCTFYLVRGMAFWSTLSITVMKGNVVWLLALTGTTLFFPQIFLVASIALGLFDQWFLLRDRLNPSIGDNP